MDTAIHETLSGKIVEILSDDIVLADTDDALTLIYEAGELDSGKIILYESQIVPDFFDLSTRLAGDILQKFSNYRLQVAIIGDFNKYKSKSLRDFIYECNKGNRVLFLEKKDDALQRLASR